MKWYSRHLFMNRQTIKIYLHQIKYIKTVWNCSLAQKTSYFDPSFLGNIYSLLTLSNMRAYEPVFTLFPLIACQHLNCNCSMYIYILIVCNNKCMDIEQIMFMTDWFGVIWKQFPNCLFTSWWYHLHLWAGKKFPDHSRNCNKNLDMLTFWHPERGT